MKNMKFLVAIVLAIVFSCPLFGKMNIEINDYDKHFIVSQRYIGWDVFEHKRLLYTYSIVDQSVNGFFEIGDIIYENQVWVGINDEDYNFLELNKAYATSRKVISNWISINVGYIKSCYPNYKDSFKIVESVIGWGKNDDNIVRITSTSLVDIPNFLNKGDELYYIEEVISPNCDRDKIVEGMIDKVNIVTVLLLIKYDETRAIWKDFLK